MSASCKGDVSKASEGLTAVSRLRPQAAAPGEQSDGRRGEDSRHHLWAEEPGGVLQEEAGGLFWWIKAAGADICIKNICINERPNTFPGVLEKS